MQQLISQRYPAPPPAAPTPGTPGNPYIPGVTRPPGSLPQPGTGPRRGVHSPVHTELLEHISMGRYNREGYNIRVNYTPRTGELILLQVDGVAFDITRGFTNASFKSLLAYFIGRNIFSRTSIRFLEATAVVCTRATSGGTPMLVFSPGCMSPVPMMVNVGLTSQTRPLPVPVLPLPGSLPRGAAALAAIGQSTPKLLYVTQNGAFAGRMLYFFMGYNWFVYDSKFEVNPEKRGLDCTTYLLSCYRRIEPTTDGVVLVNNLGVSKPVLGRSDGETTRQYLQNNPGNYIVLKFASENAATTKHVLGHSGGNLHHFSPSDPAGYHCNPVSSYSFDLYYQLHQMP